MKKGEKLKNLLVSKGINPESFAESIGVSSSSVFKYYNKEHFDSELLEKFSKILSVPVGYFFDEDQTGNQINASGSNMQIAGSNMSIRSQRFESQNKELDHCKQLLVEKDKLLAEKEERLKDKDEMIQILKNQLNK